MPIQTSLQLFCTSHYHLSLCVCAMLAHSVCVVPQLHSFDERQGALCIDAAQCAAIILHVQNVCTGLLASALA